jgi:hypothetical protein
VASDGDGHLLCRLPQGLSECGFQFQSEGAKAQPLERISRDEGCELLQQLGQNFGQKRSLALSVRSEEPAESANQASAVTASTQPLPSLDLKSFKRARADVPGVMPTVAAAKRPVTTKPVLATIERRPVSQLSATVDESEAASAHESRPMQEDGTQATLTERIPMPATSLKLDLNKSFKRGPTQADLAVKPSGPSSQQRKAPTMPQWLLEPSERILAEARRLLSCAPQELRALGVPQLKIVLKELKVPAQWSLRPSRSAVATHWQMTNTGAHAGESLREEGGASRAALQDS